MSAVADRQRGWLVQFLQDVDEELQRHASMKEGEDVFNTAHAYLSSLQNRVRSGWPTVAFQGLDSLKATFEKSIYPVVRTAAIGMTQEIETKIMWDSSVSKYLGGARFCFGDRGILEERVELFKKRVSILKEWEKYPEMIFNTQCIRVLA